MTHFPHLDAALADVVHEGDCNTDFNSVFDWIEDRLTRDMFAQPSDDPNMMRVYDLRAAIAELIAADKEYDEAKVAHAKAVETNASCAELNDVWVRLAAAIARRASALAAVEQQS